MDIHKPKPWHGVREFLKEYLIIVVGVLTALGAEQVVETLHLAHQARETEALVRQEFATNVAFARERVVVAPCITERLDELRGVLLSTPTGRPLPRLTLPQLFNPPRRPIFWKQWEGAVAAGVVGRFPPERRNLYARAYATAARINDNEREESPEWARLASLDGGARPIDPATREQLLQTIELARAQSFWVNVEAKQLADVVAPLGLPDARLKVALVTSTQGYRLCRSLLAAPHAPDRR